MIERRNDMPHQRRRPETIAMATVEEVSAAVPSAEQILLAQHTLFLALNQRRALPETFRLCLDAALRVSAMECGGIYLADAADGLRDACVSGLSDDLNDVLRYYLAESTVGEQLRRGAPVYLSYPDLGLSLIGMQRHGALQALAAVPVCHERRFLAVLVIGSHAVDRLSLLSRLALEGIASLIGVSIRQTQADEALRNSEARFRATFGQAEVGIAHAAIDGRWLRVNRKLCDIVGYSAEELLTLTFQDITYPDDLLDNLEPARRMLAGEMETYIGEKRYVRKDGGIVWVKLSVTLTRKPDGEPDYFISVTEDIHARKQAEEALRLFSRVFEQTASTVVITDTEGRIEYVNPRFTETTGYAVEEAIGQRPNLLKSKHTPMEEYRCLWRTITRGEVWKGEFRNRRKDGSLYWESAIISPVRDDQGRITHFVGIKDDITERKLAEAALKESEADLKKAQQLARIGNCKWDLRTDLTMWSDEVYAIFDREPALPAVGYKALRHYFSAAGWEQLSAAVDKTIRDGTPYELDLEILRNNGGRRWVHVRGEPVRDAEGTIVELHGMIQDITERKLAEAAVAEREARYRAVIETTADGFMVHDAEGRILEVNDAYLRRSGYSRHELLATPIVALDAMQSPEEMQARIRRERCYGVDLFETRHRAKSGEVWPVEIHSSYWPAAGGRFFVFVHDITERKILERQIIKVSTAEQERIGREIHDGIGQQLTAVGMLANSLERKLAQTMRSQEAKTAGDLVTYLQQVVGETKALAKGLSPIQIGPDGLVDALVMLMAGVRASSGLDCRLEVAGDIGALEELAAVHLYRIAQESVNNAIKHARAASIRVELRSTERTLVLSIRDDGIGIDPMAERESGLGLPIMRYRAGIIGALLSVAVVAGGGTEIECVWHRRAESAGRFIS